MKEIYQDYVSAEVTLFWTADPDGERSRLIFAVTELVPKNQLPSEPLGGGKTPYWSKTVRSKSKLKVQCRRFFCTVEQAVTCFEQFDWTSLGAPAGLKKGKSLKRQPSRGYSVVLPQAHIPLGLESPGLSMVLPNRSTSFRTYAFLEDERETEVVFSDGESNAIQKFVRQCCGADLSIYREFWGASILCMQNPVIWDYKSFGIDEGGQLHLLLLPRDGKTVVGMRYMVQTQHPFGLSDANMTEISSEIIAFPMPSPEMEARLYLWDKAGNLLEARPLSFWGRAAHATWQRRLLPDGKTIAVWPDEYYKMRQKEKTLLQQQEEIRMYQTLEKKKQFFYFKAGETQRARNIVGGLLACAGIEVTICDMYLDAAGFDECIKGWVQCQTLTIFASKKWLLHGSDKSGIDRVDEIKTRMKELVDGKMVKSALLYGVSGGQHDNGLVHDRFFVVDGTAYCIGSSLHGLGSRDTVLFRAPNPQVFLDRAAEWKGSHADLLYDGEGNTNG